MTIPHPFEKQIIGEVWTSTEIYANVERLCDCGSRFAGTPGERLARDLIQAKFIEYGLQEVRLATFDYTSWARGQASLGVVKPAPRDLPSALSLVYSPGTPPQGLYAGVIDVGMGTEAEYTAQGDKIRDRLVLASSASPAAGRWVHRREKYGRAVAGGAAGFLFANHQPGLLAPTGSLRPGQVAEIPAVGLSYEDGFVIRRLLRQGGGPVELRLRLNNHTAPAQFSHVIGQTPGRRYDEIIVVGAHYDGHDIAQGAVDDASGTALVMELARIFAPLAGQLRRTLRFEAYAAEELGVLGSTLYVNAMTDADLAVVDLMINLDGGALGGGRGLALQGITELQPLLAALARDMGYPLDLKNQIGAASDHFPYLMRGVPALSILAHRPPGVGRGFGHTRADTLDKVDEIELRESAMLVARLLLYLADQPGIIAHHRTPDEIQQILRQHDLEEPLKAQGKWPF